MVSYHTLLKHSHGFCSLSERQRLQSDAAFTFSCYCRHSPRCSPWLTGETPHYHINLSSISFRPRLFLLCLSLSLSSSFLSSLAARLAGCQLLIYTGNILAMMAGLWVVPNAIQQTGDRVSDRLAGICEEEER